MQYLSEGLNGKNSEFRSSIWDRGKQTAGKGVSVVRSELALVDDVGDVGILRGRGVRAFGISFVYRFPGVCVGRSGISAAFRIEVGRHSYKGWENESLPDELPL